MTEKNPRDRISSGEALNHPAFEIILSKSPLVIKNEFDPKDLLKIQQIEEA